MNQATSAAGSDSAGFPIAPALQLPPEAMRELEIQLTRGFRALKLWMSIQVFGLAAVRAAVGRGIALAELAERQLRATASWEVVSPAQLGVVTFRYPPPDRSQREIDELVGRIARASIEDGFATISTTVLRGRPILRLCTINPRPTDADIAAMIGWLIRLARAVSSPRNERRRPANGRGKGQAHAEGGSPISSGRGPGADHVPLTRTASGNDPEMSAT